MAVERVAVGPHFDAAEFDGLIADHGTPALWRPAIACPCRDPRTGHAEPDCPACEHGLGVVWGAGRDVTILAPGRHRQEQYDVAGVWMQGVILLTFPSTVVPAHLDLVVLLAAQMPVNMERLVRGAVDRLGRTRERVRMPLPLRLERCVALLDGELVDYEPGRDVDLAPDGTVLWGESGPPSGTPYAVRYLARPAYVVWAPQSRDEAARTMPFRAMAQRLDFFVGGVGFGER